jgi:hypothetical protein
VAVPVLILGEIPVGMRLVSAVAELRRSNVLAPEDTPELDRLLTQAHERWRGWGVNVVFVILTFTVTAFSLCDAPQLLTGGWHYDGGRMTLAGWWYVLVSVTLLRFLVLRWLWRLMLWVRVLWRTAHLTLNLKPTHPDRAGSLAFLGSTQASFGVVVFALSVQLSCLIADAVYFRGADLMSFRALVMAFVLIVVLALLAPLLVFTPKLMLAREESLVFLSGSGYQGAENLDQKLRAGRSGDLPASDISGLSDFGVLYENAQRMWTVPLELRHVGVLVLAAVLPIVPLVFLVMPADQVLRTLAELLL